MASVPTNLLLIGVGRVEWVVDARLLR